MSQKLLIALDSATPPQRDAVTGFVRENGWCCWHWLGDVWLIADAPDEVTPRGLWLDLIGSDPALTPVKGLVLKMGQWMTFFGGNDPESWVWLLRNWGRVDFDKPRPGPPAG